MESTFLFSSSAHACQTCYLAVTVGDCDFALSNDCIAEFLGGCGKIFFFSKSLLFADLFHQTGSHAVQIGLKLAV